MYFIQNLHLSSSGACAILHSRNQRKKDRAMRIVIKIGTSTITHPTGRLNIRQMEAL